MDQKFVGLCRYAVHLWYSCSLVLQQEQARTHEGKFADIVALDLNGNSVIIELKKDKAAYGADVQALKYLASFSKLKGKDFIREFFPNLKRIQNITLDHVHLNENQKK